MTRLQIKVEVCDVCRMQGRPIEHYRIAPPDGRVQTLALCEQDARTPLSELLARFYHRPVQRERKAASIDEVKAARTRAPAKKRAVKKP